MKQISQSPINNNPLQPYLSCIDYTVSRETFSIFIDKKSGILVTTPRPTDKDLAKYYESTEYISHSNSRKSFIDKIYHIVRNYSVKKKVKLINSFTSESKSLLDIGAGTGDFLATCKNSGWNISGIEPNQGANQIAKQKTGVAIQSDIQEIENKQFDVITMWHVLEHVPDLNEYILKIKSLLKPNGMLVVAIPNYKSFDATHYKEFWAGYDVPRHLWHFSREAIYKLFEQDAMKVVKVIPMKFDSYYVSILSEKYKKGKTNVIKAFWTGLRSNFKARSTKEYSSLIYIIKSI